VVNINSTVTPIDLVTDSVGKKIPVAEGAAEIVIAS
jgi:hypothetical protein